MGLSPADGLVRSRGRAAAQWPAARADDRSGRTYRLTKTAGHRYLATRVVPHQQRNLALVELSAPVTDIAPARVSANAPAVGDALRIAGYGRTATDWVPDRLHAGTFTVQSV